MRRKSAWRRSGLARSTPTNEIRNKKRKERKERKRTKLKSAEKVKKEPLSYHISKHLDGQESLQKLRKKRVVDVPWHDHRLSEVFEDESDDDSSSVESFVVSGGYYASSHRLSLNSDASDLSPSLTSMTTIHENSAHATPSHIENLGRNTRMKTFNRSYKWHCDGASRPGGCVRDADRKRHKWCQFRCEKCDFNLCEGCVLRTKQEQQWLWFLSDKILPETQEERKKRFSNSSKSNGNGSESKDEKEFKFNEIRKQYLYLKSKFHNDTETLWESSQNSAPSINDKHVVSAVKTNDVDEKFEKLTEEEQDQWWLLMSSKLAVEEEKRREERARIIRELKEQLRVEEEEKKKLRAQSEAEISGYREKICRKREHLYAFGYDSSTATRPCHSCNADFLSDYIGRYECRRCQRILCPECHGAYVQRKNVKTRANSVPSRKGSWIDDAWMHFGFSKNSRKAPCFGRFLCCTEISNDTIESD